jgi:DNA topoisomerase-1
MARSKSRSISSVPFPSAFEVPAASAPLLRHVSDQGPGITRRRAGRAWCYRGPAGEIIRDPRILTRIRALAIPPAYREVWICPDPEGHIQASGRDARGRKQYRYHPAWRSTRDAAKYDRIGAFVRVLPCLRAQVDADLVQHGLPRDKVIAIIIRLMEITYIRIGNPEYARQNKSFGLTTLRGRHARLGPGRVELSFRGKSGIKRQVVVRNRQLIRLIRRLKDLPGQELFQYLDVSGEAHGVGSGDVNDYLRRVTGAEITAKDFRTWAGTYLAILALAGAEVAGTEAARKSAMLRVIEEVAAALGNTPAICRKCYIHPSVLDAHLAGALADRFTQLVQRFAAAPPTGLSAEEAAVQAFIEAELAGE